MDNQIKDLEKILKNLNESLLEKEERNKIKKFYYDEDIVGLLTQNILDQIELNEIHTKFNKELIEKEIGVKKETNDYNNLNIRTDDHFHNNYANENVFTNQKKKDLGNKEKDYFITIQSNKDFRKFNQNESSICTFSEQNKKGLIESQNSLDNLPKSINLNYRSRNKFTDYIEQLKSLNDFENVSPINEAYLGHIKNFNHLSANNQNNFKTPISNLYNKNINFKTVHDDSGHKNVENNLRNLNLKINSTANLINNIPSKLDRTNNTNSQNNYLASNAIKSYKNFNEINTNIKENYGLSKEKSEKKFLKDNHYQCKVSNQKLSQISSNFTNYKIIKPQKNNKINFIKKHSNITNNQEYRGIHPRRSFELDKPLANLHVSQNQLEQNDAKQKFLNKKTDLENELSSKIIKTSNNNEEFRKQELCNNKLHLLTNYNSSEFDKNLYSSKSKSPVLKNRDNKSIMINANLASNFVLEEVNNNATKFSRNEKKNILHDITINTINNSNNLEKLNFLENHYLSKNNLSSYKTYNMVNSMEGINKPKNSYNKSIDSIKNLYLGISQQSLTCINKEQKKIKYEGNVISVEVGKNANNSQSSQLKRQVNIDKKNVNKSISNSYNQNVLNSESNKIKDNSSSQIIENNKFKNKTSSTVSLITNENYKAKRSLINLNKKNENYNLHNNFNHYILNGKNSSINLLSETPSNKKISKDSKFKK